MKTILVLLTSAGRARREWISGIREFAKSTDWNVQVAEFEGARFPVRELVKFWSPVGCIAEAGGDSFDPKPFSPRAIGETRVVFLGDGSRTRPHGSTCIVHDAVAVGEMAAREFLTLGLENFAFLGLATRRWSRRRQEAFGSALALNGRNAVSFELRPDGKNMQSLTGWLKKLPKPCALFAASDSLAETAISACKLAKISIPRDISVIGVDNEESICENTTPTLSSIKPDFRQGGRFAARILARMLLDPSNVIPDTVFGISGIVRRGSTRILKRHDEAVSAALERIWAPGGERLTPKEILAGFPCSRRNAETRFRSITGCSVLEVLRKARIARAKTLLTETGLSISHVAEQVGYASQAHFRDAFRADTGLNPTAWRKDALPTSAFVS